jgi:hypothetical protein
MCSNAPLMISAHSSGSSRRAAAVDPLMSQNIMVTIRRSPSIARLLRASSSLVANSRGINRSKGEGSARAAALGADCELFDVANWWPQFIQNLAPAGFSVWHWGQICTILLPQFMQNFAPSGFSVWQLGHSFISLASCGPFACRCPSPPSVQRDGRFPLPAR